MDSADHLRAILGDGFDTWKLFSMPARMSL
jgi:hypothetical protein